MTLLIAHRGYAGVAPENTLPAFQAVASGRHPADMIEFDVMPSADGTVVIFHDTRLDSRGRGGNRGITDGAGVVWETPTAELLETRILGSSATIPELSTVLETIPPEVGLNIELRNPGSFDTRFGEAVNEDVLRAQRTKWDPFVETVVELVDRHDHEVVFSSFCEAAIAAARDRAPEYPAAVNVYDSLEDALTVAERYDCDAIHPRKNMIRGTTLFEQPSGSLTNPSFGDIDLLTTAEDLGASVNVWTVRTWYEARQLLEGGVDGLIADYPGLLDERSEMR